MLSIALLLLLATCGLITIGLLFQLVNFIIDYRQIKWYLKYTYSSKFAYKRAIRELVLFRGSVIIVFAILLLYFIKLIGKLC